MNWRRFIRPFIGVIGLSLLLPLTVLASAAFTEGFEGGVVPPAGWTLKKTNAAATWGISGWSPHGGLYSASCPAAAKNQRQNEVLITGYLYFPGCPATLTLWSMGPASCGDLSGNTCDLKVWLVRGDWDGGKVNDILLGKADAGWDTDWTWALSNFTLTESLIKRPFRIAFQYKAPKGVSKAPIYLDDIAISGCYDLVKNRSFEDGPAIPAHWQGVNLGLNDKRDDTTGNWDSCSFRMRGSAANKALKQIVNIPGPAGYSFDLYGYSKAEGPDPSGGPYCLEAKVFHKDGTTKSYQAHFSKTSHDWAFTKKSFTTVKPFNKIEIYLRYADQTGRAWFDDVTLYPKY